MKKYLEAGLIILCWIIVVCVLTTTVIRIHNAIVYVHKENIRKDIILEMVRSGQSACFNMDTLYQTKCENK